MPLRARLFGTDREEIVDLDSWREHAPPEKPEIGWRDHYSAKEQAKAWLRSGRPAVPDELWSALAGFAGDADEMYARPEHRTKLDDYGRAPQHDMFGCARRGGATTLVVGVEAKACEDFGGLVADRAKAGPPSRKRARCNLLSRALFGRDVIDEDSGAILDEVLSRHGYQLWTAAVGTLIETQQRGVDTAALVVHQFRPRVPLAGDTRGWERALDANARAFDAFAADFGGVSHATEFVRAGTPLHVLKVESLIDP